MAFAVSNTRVNFVPYHLAFDLEARKPHSLDEGVLHIPAGKADERTSARIPGFENAKSIVKEPNKRGFVVLDSFPCPPRFKIDTIGRVGDNCVHAFRLHLPEHGEAVPVKCPAPELDGAALYRFVLDLPPHLHGEGQRDRHLQGVGRVVVLPHGVLEHLVDEGLVLLGELDIPVLYEGLQALDAGVFVLDAVDLLNGEILATLRRPLPHDLGEVVLKLNRLDAELIEGLLVLAPEPPGVIQGVVDDLVRLPFCYVGDHDVEVARGGVLREADDRRGVALAVLAQRGVVRSDEDEL